MIAVAMGPYPPAAPSGEVSRPHGWFGPARLLGRLGLLGVMTLATGLVYKVVLEPWHRTWGTTADEQQRSLPGDELLPDAAYVATRAVTINAPPEAIWPWLVQMGQGRGGLYSYELLENLVGSDLHNADRIHPEWQRLDVGDVIRPVPNGYLGLENSPEYTVAAIEPNRFLVLNGFATFVLDPVNEQTTRLLMRGRGNSALQSMEPFNFIMVRRQLIGIKERVEGAMRPRALDHAEVLLWTVAGSVVAVAGISVLVRQECRQPLTVMAGATTVLLVLLFPRPPLWIGALLDLPLVAALAWTLRPGLRLSGP